MNEFMLTILKGYIYGIFSISPGLSGGFIATYFGDYQKCIDILTLKRVDRKSITYIVIITFSFICGVISFSNVISALYSKYNHQFIFTIIIINILILLSMVKKYNIKTNLKLLLISLILSTILHMNHHFDYIRFTNGFVYMLSGTIYSVTKIIPGISGTSILINIGFYDKLMLFFSNPLKVFISDFGNWLLFISLFIVTSIILLSLYNKYRKVVNIEKVIIIIMIINIIDLII